MCTAHPKAFGAIIEEWLVRPLPYSDSRMWEVMVAAVVGDYLREIQEDWRAGK